ncbi:unnamed protein product [Acanthosepion pharaonis]|uniref:Uncharacterized protein n=1 Tax=Acanthosepion pharaonis TaxID=158019 RepID=A0A812B8W7_ACAPH|nr:unnamed protein product [Sepia pharaonis]
MSTIPSVNDLLEQPLQNETSEDEIMQDQVGQNEFESLDEDQIMQEDAYDYSVAWDRSRSPRERNSGEREVEQSNETIIRRICSYPISPHQSVWSLMQMQYHFLLLLDISVLRKQMYCDTHVRHDMKLGRFSLFGIPSFLFPTSHTLCPILTFSFPTVFTFSFSPHSLSITLIISLSLSPHPLFLSTHPLLFSLTTFSLHHANLFSFTTSSLHLPNLFFFSLTMSSLCISNSFSLTMFSLYLFNLFSFLSPHPLYFSSSFSLSLNIFSLFLYNLLSLYSPLCTAFYHNTFPSHFLSNCYPSFFPYFFNTCFQFR